MYVNVLQHKLGQVSIAEDDEVNILIRYSETSYCWAQAIFVNFYCVLAGIYQRYICMKFSNVLL